MGRQGSPGAADGARLSLFHRLFDRLYPAIRFVYERLLGHDWFSQVGPRLWLGGAPSRPADYDFLLARGIDAVLDVRAERTDDTAFYERHGIAHVRFAVPDIAAPDEATIEAAVIWIDEQLRAGRTVLVHCAKGRGRSATVLAAYLMAAEGLDFERAAERLRASRALTKLEGRHRRVLERWRAGRANGSPPVRKPSS